MLPVPDFICPEYCGCLSADGTCGNALVIGSEVLSKLVDWTDRGSCILFGDGAGAVVVERCEASPGILGRALHSDGTGGGVLQCGARELTTPYARTSAAKRIKTADG